METSKRSTQLKAMQYKKFLLLFCVYAITNIGVAQNTISGKINDTEGYGVPYALVQVDTSILLKTVSNEKGWYEITNVPTGFHKITVKYTGFKIFTKVLEVKKGSEVALDITLEDELIELGEVTVHNKTLEEELKEEPYNVTIVNVESLKNQNLDVNQVLSTSSGIRIRESGGLGSDFSFSLNGFSGNQVKFFIDGIPMDNFGSSLTLNNIPVNLISRIEIYKGVVPVRLGADALGGAINIVHK